jgi:peptidoglycan/LPS O-acetylase OafA/YrhL
LSQPSGGTSGRRPHFRGFDGLRAIAAGTVLVHHAANLAGSDHRTSIGAYFDHMDIGVAIFFLISGFLLYRPFVWSHLAGDPSPGLGRYFRHRALRIFPAYWVALTVIVVVFGAAALQIRNVWDAFVYYGLFQIYSPAHLWGGVAQAWSLCTELSFYAFLPLYALLVRRLARGGDDWRVLGVEIAGLATMYWASVAFRVWEFHAFPAHPETLRWLPANLDYFALGMGLAVASSWSALRADRRSAGRGAGWASAASWALAGVCFWLVASRYSVSRGVLPGLGVGLATQALYGAAALFLLLPAVFAPGDHGVVQRLLSSRPMAYAGKVSYGVYLWHVFVLLLWYDATGTLFFSGGLTRLLLTGAVGAMLLASVSWFAVERPALNLARRIDRDAARRRPPAVPPTLDAPGAGSRLLDRAPTG